MTQENTYHEAETRRFLLGEMAEEERTALEERFITDANLFEQISVIEDDLMESYVRDLLDSPTRKKFEKYFRTTEKRRARVRFTRAMLGIFFEYRENGIVKKTEVVAARSSFWDLITTPFKNPIFALGTVLAILLLAFGNWFLLKNPSDQEIARQPAPTPIVNEKKQPGTSPLVNSNQNDTANLKSPERTETNKNGSGQKTKTPDKNSNDQNEERKTVDPVLALFAGTIRSEGKTKELTLPSNAGNVSLQLNLESTDYKIYQAEIVTPDGEIVLKRTKLSARKSKINFAVPAEKLRRGDYLIKLSALNPNNEIESIADYSFRINRK